MADGTGRARHPVQGGTSGDVHSEVHGAGGRLLFLLHGLSQDHATFHELCEHLPQDDYTFHRVDLPGHGRSARLERYAVAPMVERVAGLIQGQNRPVSLYGHSLGALVAMGVAARCPDAIDRLVLSDPPLVFWDDDRWADSIISSYFGWVRKTMRGNEEEERDLAAKLQGVFPHRAAATVQRQARALSRFDLSLIDTLFESGLATRGELEEWLQEIRCPVLVLQADPRVLAAADDADVADLAARLEQFRHVKFDKADHDLHLWKPQRVASVVHDFLQSGEGVHP